MVLFENVFKSCFDKIEEEVVVLLNKLVIFVISFLVFYFKGELINFDF